MDWDTRLVDSHDPNPEPGTLAPKAAKLIEDQKKSWPLLQEGYAGLETVELKRLLIPGTKGANVVVQHNPARIRSTAAAVDAESIRSRQCFLCAANLPKEEKAIGYGRGLVIACNPFPVLDRHLSIIHRDHIEQKIDGNAECVLSLARDLGPEYFTLYNGPRSGASAPDHLHFQACSRALLPIQDDLRRFGLAELTTGNRAPFVHSLEDCGRSVIVVRGTDLSSIAAIIHTAVARLPIGPALQVESNQEPMLNLISAFDEPMWTVYLFPRSQHRPSFYFSKDEDRLTVSPGAIDMAGVIVVPDREHFDRIGPQQVGQIFSEVSVDSGLVRRIVQDLQRG